MKLAMSSAPATETPATDRKKGLLYKLRGKLQGLKHLLTLIRLTVNWQAIWRNRRGRGQLPSLHLRNGIVLHHGPYDSPLLLLDEVFAKRWYEIGAKPQARYHARCRGKHRLCQFVLERTITN